jgi:hypothetical protein
MSEQRETSKSGDTCAPDCKPDAETPCPCGPEGPSKGFGKKLRRIFGSCAACAGSGAGSALLSHAGCILAVVIGGASGAALSAKMMSVMIFTSPVIAAGVTAAIDYARTRRVSVPKMALSAAFGAAVAFGVHHYAMGGHEHHHHDHGAPTEKVDPHKGHHMQQGRSDIPPFVQAQEEMCGSPRPPARQP